MKITEGVAHAGLDDVRALTLVVSAPRTGSTLLCRDLASLGGLGSPREYFRGFERLTAAGQGAESDVLERIAQGVQDDAPGVGAAKLMVQQARAVAEALTGRRSESSAEAVATVVRWAHDRFDRVVVLVLVRNTLDQAISRAVADVTGIYHSTSKEYRAEGERSIEGVDMNAKIMRELLAAVRDRLTLHTVAEEHADSALLLTYEQLTADPDGTARRVVEHARARGFTPRLEVPQRRLRKVVSEERSEQLRRSFLDFLASEPGF